MSNFDSSTKMMTMSWPGKIKNKKELLIDAGMLVLLLLAFFLLSLIF
jgi:hypothetical protein